MTGSRPTRASLLERAAEMRRNPTEPEKRLWAALRGSRLGGCKFRHQAVIGERIVDFFCPARGLIVEVDGHTHDPDRDARRDSMMQARFGFRTFRVRNADVMENLDGVLVALGQRLAEAPERWAGRGARADALHHPPDSLHHPPAPSSEEEGEAWRHPLARYSEEEGEPCGADKAPSSSEEGVGGGGGARHVGEVGDGGGTGTVTQALREAAARLAASSDTPRLSAELLMAQALGVTRSELLLRHMDDAAPAGFAGLVARRLAHEPVAYILGRQEFFGLDLRVSPDVLIPRGDSEVLVEAAVAARPDAARVLDCGTGSGALLLAVLSLLPGACGIGIDRSPAALAVARENARRLGLAERARMVEADWRQPGWCEGLGAFDLVLANPPYVETGAELAPSVRAHEPHGALFAGPDGLDDYRVLVPRLEALLCRGGVALLEIGHTQAEAVTRIAREAGLTARLHRDLGDRPRVLELAREG